MFCEKFIFKSFSSRVFPMFNLTRYLNKQSGYMEDCQGVAEAFKNYGAVVVKDPRVDMCKKDEVIDMLEGYFQKRSEQLKKDRKVDDLYPEYWYQIGVTPEKIEQPKNFSKWVESLPEVERPLTPQPPPYNLQWKFAWRIGEECPDDLEIDPHKKCIPEEYNQTFAAAMNDWATLELNTVFTVSEMAALGLGLESDTFSKLLQGGPHLFHPTGSDMDAYKPGTIFNGLHYDPNFLTIHGRSRYPGLYLWKKNQEKFPAWTPSHPQDALMLQAGIQFESLTGGQVLAGMHEVIYTEDAAKALDNYKKIKNNFWRVAALLFAQVRHDALLEPLTNFKNAESSAKYPPITAYEQLKNELRSHKLSPDHAHLESK